MDYFKRNQVLEQKTIHHNTDSHNNGSKLYYKPVRMGVTDSALSDSYQSRGDWQLTFLIGIMLRVTDSRQIESDWHII